MTYPRLEISIEKIQHNAKRMVELCKEFGIEVVGVNKVNCGAPEVAQAMVNGGVTIIGDSRIENLMLIEAMKVRKLFLRLPMISRAEEVVRYSDISLNSELKTIKKLSEEAEKIGKIHEIILMIDVGDLREGIFDEEDVMATVEASLKLKHIKLIGIGTNLTCFGGIIPSEENLGKLIKLKNEINKRFDIDLEVLSGGNSSSVHLLQSRKMPKDINQLRLGTSIVLGTVEINETRIDDTYDDAFRLVAEIVEIKEKPSKPIGEIGIDAFGNKPKFEDKGIMKRAICAIGKQDVDLNWMIPLDEKISILGGSSDHLIVDVTQGEKKYEVGDKLTFILNYIAILKAMTSTYIKKYYI